MCDAAVLISNPASLWKSSTASSCCYSWTFRLISFSLAVWFAPAPACHLWAAQCPSCNAGSTLSALHYEVALLCINDVDACNAGRSVPRAGAPGARRRDIRSAAAQRLHGRGRGNVRSADGVGRCSAVQDVSDTTVIQDQRSLPPCGTCVLTSPKFCKIDHPSLTAHVIALLEAACTPHQHKQTCQGTSVLCLERLTLANTRSQGYRRPSTQCATLPHNNTSNTSESFLQGACFLATQSVQANPGCSSDCLACPALTAWPSGLASIPR